MSIDLVQLLQQQVAASQAQDPIEAALHAELAGDDELGWVVERMALPHWFDAPMVAALLPESMRTSPDLADLGQPVDYVGKLLDLSFVVELPRPAGQEERPPRYEINRAVRAFLLKRWQADERRDGLIEAGRFYRDYFNRQSRKASALEQSILQREALYHSFAVNDRAALDKFRSMFDDAQGAYEFGVCQALLNLAQEQDAFLQHEDVRVWLQYYQGRLHLLLGKWTDAQQCFEETLKRPKLPVRLHGMARAGLGDVWRAEGNWAKAMAEYDRSLEILLNLGMYRLVDKYAETALKVSSVFVGGLTRKFVWEPLARAFRWLLSTQYRQREIRNKAKQVKERLEVARVLTGMAELAQAMGQPVRRLSEHVELLELAHIDQASAFSRADKPLTLFQKMWQREQKMNVESSRRRQQAERVALTSMVHQRLQSFAEHFYRQALEILAPPGGDTTSHQASGGPLLENLIWDIRFGLATVLLHQDKVSEARANFKELLVGEERPREKAQLIMALGDCDLAEDKTADATDDYQRAVKLLQDNWDKALWATALHRLGYVEALNKNWQAAVEHLKTSRTTLADLGLNREEEQVQETWRDLARVKRMPEDMQKTINVERASWLAQYFAYSSSTEVLKRIKSVWWPALIVAGLLLTVPIFFFYRIVGTWFLGLFGAGYVFGWPWVNAILALICLAVALVILDQSGGFSQWVARRLPLDTVWGTQPGFVRVDDTRFVYVDHAGQARALAWNQVTQLRRAYSTEWVASEASVFASGGPGGRTLLVAPQGMLTFDASINSYFELDEFVLQRVPEKVQERREFSATARGLPLPALGIVALFAMCGCPTIGILTSQNPAWWMTALKVVAWVGVAILGLEFGIIIVWMLAGAIRLHRFLDLRHLPGPPPIEAVEPAEHYLAQSKRSL
jgi:tetratricopeptide (TPR) repeat protein